MSTPFMGLNLPSPLVTPGPTWASLLNVALETLDSHDHTPGGGVPITPAALDINDDVDFKNHGLETVKLVNLATNAAALATPSIIHSVNGDLVWINANGTAVPITSGNSIVGSPGSIQNLVSPASAQYSASDLAFRWFSSSGVMAGHDLGFAIFRQNFGSTAPAVSVRAPSTGVTSWTLVLPPTAGVTTGGLLAVLPSGVSEYWYVDNASIESVAQSIRIKDSGVTTAKINAQAVTTAKIADLNVTTAKLADLNVTEAKIAALAVTTGKIADLNVTEAKIAAGAVTNTKLGAASITTDKIAAGQVTGGPFGSLAYYTIIGDNLVDLAVYAGKIADGAVIESKIAANAVTASKIADGAVVNAKIGYQSITTDKIQPGQVTGGPFGSMAYNTIIDQNLTSNCVTNAKIATDAVTLDKMADNSVDLFNVVTGFAFGTNSFTANNSRIGGTAAFPWFIATTGSIFLVSGKNFRITVQTKDRSTNPGIFFCQNYESSIRYVFVTITLRRTSDGSVLRQYTRTCAAYNGIAVDLPFPSITDTTYESRLQYATFEIYTNANPNVGLTMDDLALTLSVL